jgi:hypothetical protein
MTEKPIDVARSMQDAHNLDGVLCHTIKNQMVPEPVNRQEVQTLHVGVVGLVGTSKSGLVG